MSTLADREKKRAAASSIAAACVLTGMKLAVALTTNSLGILAETVHSAQDLLVAGVTFLAVRHAALPPDRHHAYGHGKVENIAALVEAVLLLLTCGWIVHEALGRLFWSGEVPKPGWAAFVVLAVSMLVDLSRSRMLRRVAQKHKSQALEADALHFSMDMLSSGVVLLGLGAVWLADFFPAGGMAYGLLTRMDALAALVVAVIVVWVSLRLARRAVNTLMDAGSAELTQKIEATVGGIPSVRGISRLRLRESGATVFVDMSLVLPAGLRLEEGHQISDLAEEAVIKLAPGADVTVHFEPEKAAAGSMDFFSQIRGTAARHSLDIHSLEAFNYARGLQVTLHTEVDGTLSLNEAHTKVHTFEEEIRRPGVEVVTHMEPRQAWPATGESSAEPSGCAAGQDIREMVERALRGEPLLRGVHNLHWYRIGPEAVLTFHCNAPGAATVEECHAACTRVEKALLKALDGQVPGRCRITIHADPM